MAEADALRETGLIAIHPEMPAPGVSSPLPAGAPADEKVMTLVDHLTELRNRIVVVLLAVAVGSALGFWLASRIISFLKAPLGTDRPLVFTGLGDAFFINLKVAIVFGVIIAMPVILYELWAFISPGLTPQERRLARPWVPLALAFFVLGVVVAYLVLPYASAFLLSFQSPDLQALITAEAYFGFVTMLFLVFGLAMEFPIVLVLLSKVGIVSSKSLAARRRPAILVIAIVAAVATPGGDPISPVILGVTMYVLFEISIWLVRVTGR
ncbi:MAG: twin-arginine translocase subunit TatC [Chloroflexota bacterium]